MAKFEEVFEDTQALFTNFISDIDNLREVNIKILASKNLKEIGKVVKANDLLKFMTKEDIIILLNETIFEQLDDEQKMMVVEELLAAIYFDAEKSKVSIIKPDINTFSLLLRKYGYEKYETLHESVKALFAQADEEAAENNL
jgi:predicted RNA-binding protein with PUA domain